MSTASLNQTKIQKLYQHIVLPQSNSHKGQNGKLLIIGGSELFHAASRWSLDIASKIVDMVFYSSVPSNNQLIHEAKQNFWNGIVIPRENIEDYLEEADCILIGPGMERHQANPTNTTLDRENYVNLTLTEQDWQTDTQKITNYLLAKYPQKKWVIDAGALQMVDPKLLTPTCVITPHTKELTNLTQSIKINWAVNFNQPSKNLDQQLIQISQQLNQATLLLKGKQDVVVHQKQTLRIDGGNAGMTKGGTGDVLAGLLASLYATNDILTSTVTASYINKLAGDRLYQEVGPFYNASDLVEMIPKVLWQLLSPHALRKKLLSE